MFCNAEKKLVKMKERMDRLECHQDCFLEMFGAILKLGERLMSAISDFAAKQDAHNKDIDKHLDGISAGIGDLKKTIADLQNNPGPISADDQKLLDKAEAQAQALEDKAHAMDNLTPPAPPPD